MAGLSGWRIEALPITHHDAALLVEEVQGEYVRRYGGRDETPIDPTYFDHPDGAFFVGYLDGRPVATGAWRRRPDVAVDGGTLEATARAAGADVMVLETGTRQPEAIALYESSGYLPIPGFGYYRDAPLSRCLARLLREPAAREDAR